MNLVGGHAGKSGRLNALEESSLENAFLINLILK
jgi:protease II